MFEVYLDGYKIKEFETETEAQIWCQMYDGDKIPTYEYVP